MLENSLRALRRRWGLVLVALLAGCAAASATFLLVPPTMQSKAAVLFVPSVRQPGVEGPTNPLLELGGSVAVVASVIQIAVTDDRTATELTSQGRTAEYEVVPDLGENAGPVLLITTEDADGAIARRTRDALVDQISRQLKELQDSRGVSRDLRVSAVLLTASPEPEALHKKQIQLSVAAGGATLSMLLLLVLLVDRRRTRRPAKDRSEVGAEALDPPRSPGERAHSESAVLTGRTSRKG